LNYNFFKFKLIIIQIISNIIQIASGSYHTLFLDTLGRVLSSGYNINWQLGRGNNTITNQRYVNFVKFNNTNNNLSNIIQICASFNSSYFLDTS
jgi:alpha-tubulin suppressor-like RCC1 family protein